MEVIKKVLDDYFSSNNNNNNNGEKEEWEYLWCKNESKSTEEFHCYDIFVTNALLNPKSPSPVKKLDKLEFNVIKSLLDKHKLPSAYLKEKSKLKYSLGDGIRVSNGLLPHLMSRIALMTLFQALYGQSQPIIGIGVFTPYDVYDTIGDYSSTVSYEEDQDIDQANKKKNKWVRICIVAEFRSLAQQIEWNRYVDEALQYTDDQWLYKYAKSFIRPIPRIPSFLLGDDGSELCQSAITSLIESFGSLLSASNTRLYRIKGITPSIMHKWILSRESRGIAINNQLQNPQQYLQSYGHNIGYLMHIFHGSELPAIGVDCGHNPILASLIQRMYDICTPKDDDHGLHLFHDALEDNDSGRCGHKHLWIKKEAPYEIIVKEQQARKQKIRWNRYVSLSNSQEHLLYYYFSGLKDEPESEVMSPSQAKAEKVWKTRDAFSDASSPTTSEPLDCVIIDGEKISVLLWHYLSSLCKQVKQHENKIQVKLHVGSGDSRYYAQSKEFLKYCSQLPITLVDDSGDSKQRRRRTVLDDNEQIVDRTPTIIISFTRDGKGTILFTQTAVQILRDTTLQTVDQWNDFSAAELLLDLYNLYSCNRSLSSLCCDNVVNMYVLELALFMLGLNLNEWEDIYNIAQPMESKLNAWMLKRKKSAPSIVKQPSIKNKDKDQNSNPTKTQNQDKEPSPAPKRQNSTASKQEKTIKASPKSNKSPSKSPSRKNQTSTKTTTTATPKKSNGTGKSPAASPNQKGKKTTTPSTTKVDKSDKTSKKTPKTPVKGQTKTNNKTPKKSNTTPQNKPKTSKKQPGQVDEGVLSPSKAKALAKVKKERKESLVDSTKASENKRKQTDTDNNSDEKKSSDTTEASTTSNNDTTVENSKPLETVVESTPQVTSEESNNEDDGDTRVRNDSSAETTEPNISETEPIVHSSNTVAENVSESQLQPDEPSTAEEVKSSNENNQEQDKSTTANVVESSVDEVSQSHEENEQETEVLVNKESTEEPIEESNDNTQEPMDLADKNKENYDKTENITNTDNEENVNTDIVVDEKSMENDTVKQELLPTTNGEELEKTAESENNDDKPQSSIITQQTENSNVESEIKQETEEEEEEEEEEDKEEEIDQLSDLPTNTNTVNKPEPKRQSVREQALASLRAKTKEDDIVLVKQSKAAPSPAIAQRISIFKQKENTWKENYYKKGDGDAASKEIEELKRQDVTLGTRVRNLNQENANWRHYYYTQGSGDVANRELEALKESTNSLLHSNIEMFTKLDIEGNDLFKKELSKMKREEKTELLRLQIRKLHTKFAEQYQMSVEESNSIYTSIEQGGGPQDIDVALEVAFSQRVETYHNELESLQRRFEERVAWYKDFRLQNDEEYEIDDEKREQMKAVMEAQILKRKTKMADMELLDRATSEMSREASCRVLRDLGVLIEDDTVLNLNSTDIFAKLSDSRQNQLKQIIKWAIEDLGQEGRLMSLQMANYQLDDEALAELMGLLENARMLTELVLDSNPITDKGILLLSDYIAKNPARLRVLKLTNLWSDITTPVMNVFLAALEKNTQITKLSMDTRLIQHRDIIIKVCERNWKRFAKMRKLQKTLLGEIQNNPKLANPRGMVPVTVGDPDPDPNPNSNPNPNPAQSPDPEKTKSDENLEEKIQIENQNNLDEQVENQNNSDEHDEDQNNSNEQVETQNDVDEQAEDQNDVDEQVEDQNEVDEPVENQNENEEKVENEID